MNQSTDLRVYKTRKALCDTFMEMMKEKSFDSITVNELCERALVRRATFYKHFMDKYDFFSFFIQYVRTEYLGKYETLTDNHSFSEFCIYYFDTFLDFVEKNKALIDNVLNSNMLPVLLDIFSEETYSHILKAMSDNRLQNNQDKLSPEVFASFYSGGMVHVLMQWLKNPNKMNKNSLKSNVKILLNSYIQN